MSFFRVQPAAEMTVQKEFKVLVENLTAKFEAYSRGSREECSN